ncbi:clpP2 [Symbiodinium necroappetens]|uniref:ATP-dependent Clp protease proteolytic subunit n=1 Tax=Symbiodinium necroappetens TaxID=1628268 RepID=A0A812LRL3_9DINO|nr:clpP2 [Symbiodinium necroappetens]
MIIAVAALSLATHARGTAGQDACEFGLLGSRANQEVLDLCASELLEAFGLGSDPSEEMDSEQQTPTCFGIMRGLGSQFGYANNTRRVCWETPNINLTSVSCEVLNSIAWELMVLALRHLALCSGLFGDVAEETHEAMADEVLQLADALLSKELELQDATPTGLLMGDKLRHLHADLVQPLQAQGHTRQVVSRLLAFSRKAFEHSNWMVWRDTHFLWLQDSLREGRVVHSAWGPSDRWEELGANDAHAAHSLLGGMSRAPAYGFVNEGSQRQDILQNLLNKLHQSRGGEQIHVVEIGVFKGSLSKFLLEKLPFVTLLGIDPYVGTDGTFPGDFSETMDPDFALSQAAAIYENFKDRAQLLPVTSDVAARSIPDGSIDAIFVDGCHLYECVDSDLQIWLPKLSGAGALVAGHDFSPQWPGVVRAVHEHRRDGHRVAYRVPGAPNAEWVDIYNRLYRERIIFIGKEIDDKLANEVIGVLLYLDSEDNNKPIYLYINSAGGSVIAGLSIYDTMQHIKSPVITINVGLAASMASFLLAAGEKGKRIALPHSRIMIHQAMGGAQGQAEDIKVEAQQILQIHENIVRMYSRVTGKDQDTIRADLMRDNFMSAEQAKDYGLIDQVIQLSDASDLKVSSFRKADILGHKRGICGSAIPTARGPRQAGGWGRGPLASPTLNERVVILRCAPPLSGLTSLRTR